MIVIIILAVNIVYVSASTIRMILTLKGRHYVAAAVSMLEVVVYIIGLSIVLDNLDGIQNIAAYAIGYALGIIIGSKIEERMALGYITINVVSSNPELDFENKLRKEGFGVTSWNSSGRDGDRAYLEILTPRKQEMRLYQLITNIDPAAFMVAYEPKYIKGGFWVRQVRKGKLYHQKGDKKGQEVDPPDVTLSDINETIEKKVNVESEDELMQGIERPNQENTNVTTKL